MLSTWWLSVCVSLPFSINMAGFLFEHPLGAPSWHLQCVRYVSNLEGVQLVEIDMCAAGMIRASDGLPVRKPTGMLTNDSILARDLATLKCDHSHTHVPFLGGHNSHEARAYPPKLCSVIVSGLRESLQEKFRSSYVNHCEQETVSLPAVLRSPCCRASRVFRVRGG